MAHLELCYFETKPSRRVAVQRSDQKGETVAFGGGPPAIAVREKTNQPGEEANQDNFVRGGETVKGRG